MTNLTNPALELGTIATKLTQSVGTSGAKFLAAQFDVPVWSTDFMKIIACILERADLVDAIVQRSDLAQITKDTARTAIATFKSGFTGNSLTASWNTQGSGMTMMDRSGSIIQMMDGAVKLEVRYPELTPKDAAELIALIDEYAAALNQTDGTPPFVYHAIIDGLSMLRFRLEKLGWVGSGYTLQAFREVSAIYNTVSHVIHETNPDAEAMLKGMLNILTVMKAKVNAAKGWTDAAKAVYLTYGAVSGVVVPFLLTKGAS